MSKKRKASKRRKTFTGQRYVQNSRKIGEGRYRTKLNVESTEAEAEATAIVDICIRRSTIETNPGFKTDDGKRIGRRTIEAEADSNIRSHSESVYIEFYNNRDNREQLLQLLDFVGYTIPRERIRLTEHGKRRLEPIVLHDAGHECSGIAIISVPHNRLELFLTLPFVRDVHLCKRPESGGNHQIRSKKYDKIDKMPDDPTGKYPW